MTTQWLCSCTKCTYSLCWHHGTISHTNVPSVSLQIRTWISTWWCRTDCRGLCKWECRKFWTIQLQSTSLWCTAKECVKCWNGEKNNNFRNVQKNPTKMKRPNTFGMIRCRVFVVAFRRWLVRWQCKWMLQKPPNWMKLPKQLQCHRQLLVVICANMDKVEQNLSIRWADIDSHWLSASQLSIFFFESQVSSVQNVCIRGIQDIGKFFDRILRYREIKWKQKQRVVLWRKWTEDVKPL